jgi:hypothetical protein
LFAFLQEYFTSKYALKASVPFLKRLQAPLLGDKELDVAADNIPFSHANLKRNSTIHKINAHVGLLAGISDHLLSIFSLSSSIASR